MEYIEGSEILDEIAHAGAYMEADAQMLYKQVLEGIEYLHDSRVVHRDIKPSNILITKDRQRAVLVDFNVAKKIPGDQKVFQLFTKSAGTLAYVAPERLKENQNYSEKVDMWAAGLVLVMLLTGQHPFDLTSTTAKLFAQIMDGESIVSDLMYFINYISDDAKDLVTKLVVKDPKVRLSAKEALEHPWFKKDISRSSNLLNGAVEKFQRRATLKRTRPDTIQNFERYSMGKLL